MPSAGLRRYVEAVPGDPLPHGLLSGCTTVIDVTDPHELLGTEWRPLSCADAHDTTWCPPDGDPDVPAKTFARPGICTAPPVAIYAGSECSTIGWSYAEALEHATETLRMGEQRALEEWLMREVLCEIAEDQTPDAGALSIAQGVGVLESWLGTEYGGRGVLHIPVGAGALLGCCNIAHLVDGSPETLVGNCIVLGAGYAVNVGPPDCTVADGGEAWLYATSPIRVRREPAVPVPEDDAAAVEIRTNDRRVLVERGYVVEIACCRAAAVRVRLCAD
ncbi:cupin [Streptomyces sp. NPDC057250]|uniref:cupin n=1 Tax=Streptomyces sp. NPDC057250 TaxID=3346068 RepID=UPI00363E5E60